MKKSAFTLIELSIVIVIIGLIVGSVMVGRDLIKTSEIHAQIKQIEEFKIAINVFKSKYAYLPGDMTPAQASQLGFFTFTGTYAGTICNATDNAYGNNDGNINFQSEGYVFWSHLSNANMLAGSYGGAAGNLLISDTSSCAAFSAGNPIVTPATASDFNKFLPTSKLNNGSVFMYSNLMFAPFNVPIFSNTKKNYSLIIYDMVASNDLFSAYELYQIDSKIDDGLPSEGIVRDDQTADRGLITQQIDSPCTTNSYPIYYNLSSSNANKRTCFGVDFLF